MDGHRWRRRTRRSCETRRRYPVARDGAVSGRYQPVVLAFSSHVSERNADVGEQIKIVVAVDLYVATVPIYEARRSRRQIEVEQAPDNNRV